MKKYILDLMDILKMEWNLEKEFFINIQKKNMKEIGKMMNFVEKESSIFLMEINLKAFLKRDWRKEKVFIIIKMEKQIKEFGKKINKYNGHDQNILKKL